MIAVPIFTLLICYSFACFGLGQVAMHHIRGKTKFIIPVSPITESAISFVFGQGILGNLWLLLALGGAFTPVVVTGLTIFCLISGIRFAIPKTASLLLQLKCVMRDLRSERLEWKTVGYMLIGFCFLWITSLGRSVAGDGAAFYMALAKVTASTHRLTPMPGFENFTGVGLSGEMHYAALIAMGSPDAAQLFGWPTMVSACIVLLAIGRLVGMGRRGQWIALAMILTSTAIIWLSGDGKTDLFAVALSISAYYWILQLNETDQKHVIPLSGLLLGFALVAKLSNIPVMLSSVLLLIVLMKYGNAWCSKGKTLQNISLGSIGFLMLQWMMVGFLPHILKNILLFQNPLVPFTSDSSDWLNQIWYQESTIRRIILTYPLALVYGSYEGQYGNISPLLLAFLPFVFVASNLANTRFTKSIHIAFAAIAGIVVWIIIQPGVFAPRYILPNLLLLILPVAQCTEYIALHARQFQILILGIVSSIVFAIVMLVSTFSNLVFFPLTTYQYLFGNVQECGRDTYYCKTLVFVNQISEDGDRIFVNVRQRYWLRPDLIQCLLTSDEIETFNMIEDAYSQWEYIFDRGFEYVLMFIQPENINPIVSPDLVHVPKWLKITSQKYENNILLRLESLDPFRMPSAACHETKPKIWDLSFP